jgi:hypothetical protein
VCGLHHHIAGLKLRSESFNGVRSFIGQIAGPRWFGIAEKGRTPVVVAAFVAPRAVTRLTT